MAQWQRNRTADIAAGRDERWIADCSRAIAAALLPFDHHLVRVAGRGGVLITYPWRAAPLAEQPEPFRVQISFATDRGHLPAPPHVQALIDGLTLRRWDGSEPPVAEPPVP